MRAPSCVAACSCIVAACQPSGQLVEPGEIPVLAEDPLEPARGEPIPFVEALGSLRFEPNLGQADDDALFVARALAMEARLGPRGIALLVGRDTKIVLSLADRARFEPEGLLPTTVSYLLGDDPAAWLGGVPSYERVVAREVVSGVDVAARGSGEDLVLEVSAQAGADVGGLRFVVDGADQITLDDDGALLLRGGDDVVRLERPRAYQLDARGRVAIDARFLLDADGRVGFVLEGALDPTQPLVVEPVVTFARAVAAPLRALTLDDGTLLVAGASAARGTVDGLIARLSDDGEVLFVSYLGGRDDDLITDIAVDPFDGTLLVAGTTRSVDLPTTPAAYQPRLHQLAGQARSRDAFLARLSPDGERLEAASYFGAREGTDETDAFLEVARGGVIYLGANVAALTTSPLFARFSPGLDDVAWIVHHEGDPCLTRAPAPRDGNSVLADMAVDERGQLTFVGRTDAVDLPAVNALLGEHPAPCAALDDGWHRSATVGFAARLDRDGRYLYSTYLAPAEVLEGGRAPWLASASARAVAVDDRGRAVVVGYSHSPSFPTAKRADHAGADESGAYALALTCTGEPDGAARLGRFFPADAALSRRGDLVIAGSDEGDGVVARLSPELSTATFLHELRGAGEERLAAVAVDERGRLFTAGTSTSAGLPRSTRLRGLSAETAGIVVGLAPPFAPVFTSPGGDDDTLVVAVTAAEPIALVEARIGDGEWLSMRRLGQARYVLETFVPPSSAVRFRAVSEGGDVEVSSRFLWPFGEEFPELDEGFAAKLVNVRGTDWWVEADVAANAAVDVVEARIGGGAWLPLEQTAWNSYAVNAFVAAPALVELRVVSRCGDVVVAGPFLWPEGTPVSPPDGFVADFTRPRGNAWWVEVEVGANEPLASVHARAGTGALTRLEKTDWGSWGAVMRVPPGEAVTFRAVSSGGETAWSEPVPWPPER